MNCHRRYKNTVAEEQQNPLIKYKYEPKYDNNLHNYTCYTQENHQLNDSRPKKSQN